MLPRPPLISIITVNFNSGHLLEGTARSVLAQTYPHLEYLIVDGASNDHSHLIFKLIELTNDKLLNAKILRWQSEPDKGLYDAMNKGLRLAKGDFVLFLNAGDRLFDPKTLEKAMLLCNPETDVLYGEAMLVTGTRYHLGTRSQLTVQKLPDKLTWESLRMGMTVCHQSFIARKNIAPYYMENNLAADIDWVIEVLKKSRKTIHTRLIISEYLMGGLSKQKHRQSLNDRYEVLKKHYGFWPNLWAHGKIFLRAFFADNKY
jgi:glycosyltransferase involved in cell wall biosynthesis